MRIETYWGCRRVEAVSVKMKISSSLLIVWLIGKDSGNQVDSGKETRLY